MSKKVFAPTLIQCNGCKWNTAVMGILVRKEDEITTFASNVHNGNGLICPKPELIILWTHAVISNEVYTKTFQVKE